MICKEISTGLAIFVHLCLTFSFLCHMPSELDHYQEYLIRCLTLRCIRYTYSTASTLTICFYRQYHLLDIGSSQHHVTLMIVEPTTNPLPTRLTPPPPLQRWASMTRIPPLSFDGTVWYETPLYIPLMLTADFEPQISDVKDLTPANLNPGNEPPRSPVAQSLSPRHGDKQSRPLRVRFLPPLPPCCHLPYAHLTYQMPAMARRPRHVVHMQSPHGHHLVHAMAHRRSPHSTAATPAPLPFSLHRHCHTQIPRRATPTL